MLFGGLHVEGNVDTFVCLRLEVACSELFQTVAFFLLRRFHDNWKMLLLAGRMILFSLPGLHTAEPAGTSTI